MTAVIATLKRDPGSKQDPQQTDAKSDAKSSDSTQAKPDDQEPSDTDRPKLKRRD